MPEIVEVRTDADLLDLYLSHRMLTSISFVTHLFKHKCQGLEDLQEHLPLKVERVLSRAKKLFFHLVDPNGKQNNWYIYITYGMSGNISETKNKHSHIEFIMSHCWLGFNTFYYSNARRIGSFEANNDPERYIFHITDMAKPIVLGYNDNKDFAPITRQEFEENIKACKKSYIASKLSDQRSICSGIGRYLLSEILYEAKLDPWIRCHEMTSKDVDNLWQAANRIIIESYNVGGNSMSDYVHVDGTLGEYWQIRRVYGREGETDKNGEIIHRQKGPSGMLHFVESQRQV